MMLLSVGLGLSFKLYFFDFVTTLGKPLPTLPPGNATQPPF